MQVTVEYLKRDRQGFLPGSRRVLIKGAAIDLERRGMAKIIDDPSPKPKRKRKAKSDVNSVDTDADGGSD